MLKFPARYRFPVRLLGFAVALLLTLFASVTFATTHGATGKGTSNIPFTALSFQPLSGVEGPRRAIAFGDPNRGVHGFYLRLPVGFESLLHYHTANYHAVVVEGAIVNNYEGQDKEVTLNKGGYFATRSKVNHVTKCLSNTDCIVYVQMDRAFDSIPARQSPSKSQSR